MIKILTIDSTIINTYENDISKIIRLHPGFILNNKGIFYVVFDYYNNTRSKVFNNFLDAEDYFNILMNIDSVDDYTGEPYVNGINITPNNNVFQIIGSGSSRIMTFQISIDGEGFDIIDVYLDLQGFPNFRLFANPDMPYGYPALMEAYQTYGVSVSYSNRSKTWTLLLTDTCITMLEQYPNSYELNIIVSEQEHYTDPSYVIYGNRDRTADDAFLYPFVLQ